VLDAKSLTLVNSRARQWQRLGVRLERKKLIAEAEIIERVAAVVSLRPDKEALLDEAERLRARATLMEERSWEPPTEF
jgi:hypothetical protein